MYNKKGSLRRTFFIAKETLFISFFWATVSTFFGHYPHFSSPLLISLLFSRSSSFQSAHR